MVLRARLALPLLVAALAAAPSAHAGTGGVSPPEPGASTDPAPAAEAQPPAETQGGSGVPVVSSIEVTPDRAIGGPVTIRYRVDSSSPQAEIRLYIKRVPYPRQRRVIKLGRRPTGAINEYVWRNDSRPLTGRLEVRVWARDASGKRAARTSQNPAAKEFRYLSNVFPIIGQSNFGGAGARFGAARVGHIHQGQDVIAAEGTPLVAVCSGQIVWRQFQAGGAGNYVVLRCPGELDYVYMHLKEGTTTVSQGDSVTAGQQFAQVGNTGASEGPHLHFEVWQGQWYNGGHPIDPLPFLTRWLRQANE